MLGHPDAWWNAVLKAAVKSASVAVLQQSQALHLILSHHLPWAVEALIERQVDINAAAGKETHGKLILIKAKKKNQRISRQGNLEENPIFRYKIDANRKICCVCRCRKE
jgi:hypothetical protein